MVKGTEKKFKRIEKKYLVDQEDLEALLSDLKEYLVEDDYPTSTITNIYFDTEDFQVIRDSIAKKNGREKIRMRSYVPNPTLDTQVFLELKKKDAEGVGHKYRLTSHLGAVLDFIEDGTVCQDMKDDKALIDEFDNLKERYGNLEPRMFIYYERKSYKERHHIKGQAETKIRVTFDNNLKYRDVDVRSIGDVYGNDLVEGGKLIMEIKAPSEQPQWLHDILAKHGLENQSFSKYGTAYRKSQGILQ